MLSILYLLNFAFAKEPVHDVDTTNIIRKDDKFKVRNEDGETIFLTLDDKTYKAVNMPDYKNPTYIDLVNHTLLPTLNLSVFKNPTFLKPMPSDLHYLALLNISIDSNNNGATYTIGEGEKLRKFVYRGDTACNTEVQQCPPGTFPVRLIKQPIPESPAQNDNKNKKSTDKDAGNNGYDSNSSEN